MANILLGVTGSVAAVRTPELHQTLVQIGHTVRIVATEPSLNFFDHEALVPQEPEISGATHRGPLFRDADEWGSPLYQRGDPVLHIEFRKWADLFVIAPLDANTLAKIALGLSDNFLTCIARAWDFHKPLVLAPAMNTLMWQSPITRRHLRQLLEDHATSRPAVEDWTLGQAAEVFAQCAPRLILIPPGVKRLACGDIGVGAMAEVPSIAETVRRLLDVNLE